MRILCWINLKKWPRISRTIRMATPKRPPTFTRLCKNISPTRWRPQARIAKQPNVCPKLVRFFSNMGFSDRHQLTCMIFWNIDILRIYGCYKHDLENKYFIIPFLVILLDSLERTFFSEYFDRVRIWIQLTFK